MSFVFGNNRKKEPGQTEKLLERSDFKFEELINCDNLSSAYKEKNPKLIGYLLDKENVKKLYDLLMTTDQRSLHKTVFTLYQTSNMCLHRVFADSTGLSGYAMKCLDGSKSDEELEDGKKKYAMGTFSKIISRAFDTWPQEMWQVFRHIPDGVPKVLKNLNLTCVSQAIMDLFSSKQLPYISQFMWLLFLAVIEPEYAQKHQLYNKAKWPIFCYFIELELKDIKNAHSKLTDEHKDVIYELLGHFFENSFCQMDLFYSNFFQYVGEIDDQHFHPSLFSVARSIGVNEKVRDRALGIITANIKNNTVDTPLMTQSLKYLSICASVLTEEKYCEICEKIIISLFTDKSIQATYSALIDMVKGIECQKPTWIEGFNKLISQFVAFIWNTKKADQGCIQWPIAVTIGKELGLNDDQWGGFANSIKAWGIEPLPSDDDDDNDPPKKAEESEPPTFNFDFEFPKEFYNSESFEQYKIK